MGGVDGTLLRPSGPLLEVEEDDEGEGDLMGTLLRPSGPPMVFFKCWESISLTQVTYHGPHFNSFENFSKFLARTFNELTVENPRSLE